MKHVDEKTGSIENLEDLVVFGGAPKFRETLHVGKPNIGNREMFFDQANEMFDNLWLTNDGPVLKKFELRLAELLGVRHVVAVCNATKGLEIAAKALRLQGEVILPSFTFVATAHALEWIGIRPVFCDVDPRTHTIDPQKVEALITPQTTAILGVHLWGLPCDTDALAGIARRHGLRVVYDAAHAFFCSHQGRWIGEFGDLEIFSFHATKFFNTFEGGAITTNDDQVAEQARLLRNFGFAGYDKVVSHGTNGKMSEISAAMGLANLPKLGDFIETNRRNLGHYAQGLAGAPGLRLLPFPAGEKNNFQYVVVEIDRDAAGISRDDILTVLHAERVLARRYFYPGCHKMEPYLTCDPDAGKSLPVTESLVESVLNLPNGTAVGADEIRRICDMIRFCTRNGEEITTRLKSIGS